MRKTHLGFLPAVLVVPLLAACAGTVETGDRTFGTETSSTAALVSPRAVGTEVAPGVIEIDPAVLGARRLDLSLEPDANPLAISICIGKYNGETGGCKGVFIRWGKA